MQLPPSSPMPEPTAAPPERSQSGGDAIEYYRLIRGQIEHEDNLNGQRLSWFVSAQAFLFTAYAIVVGNWQAGARGPWHDHQEQFLSATIPIVALLTCVLLYATILAGTIAITTLRRLYHRNTPIIAGSPLPPVQGYRLTQVFGQSGPLLLPPMFMVVWIVILGRWVAMG